MAFSKKGKQNKYALRVTYSELAVMSGTETLLPYVNDKKKPEEEPTIIVDSREASSAEKIVKGLIEQGVQRENAIAGERRLYSL